MKTKLFALAILILILPCNSIAQKPRTKSPVKARAEAGEVIPLKPLMRVLEEESTSGRLIWELTALASPGYKLRGGKAVAADLEAWDVDEAGNLARRAAGEMPLLKKYKSPIVTLISHLDYFGHQIASFTTQPKHVPIRFAASDTGQTMLVTDLASESSFNTLKLSAKARAAEVIRSMILPAMESLLRAAKGTNIRQVGIMVTYGSKDFSDKSNVLNLKAEAVAVVASVENCSEFTSGKITDNVFLSRASVFLADRDNEFGSLRRVAITIE